MKLHSQLTPSQNVVTAFAPDRIAINGQAYTTSLIVTADRVLTNWAPTTPAQLTEADFAPLAELDCRIVLLGTGRRQVFPPPALMRALISRQIGVEVMDSAAACRTFNILAAEGRSVAAAIILEAA